MKTLVPCLVSAAFLLALAAPAGATGAEDLAAKRKKWVAEYQELQARHMQLEHDLEQARNDYSRGRSSKHLRGEGKAGLLKEIQRLEEEYAAADQELQAFPDKARKDGAYPGWFRDVEDPQPEPAQPAAAAATRAEEPSRLGSRAQERAADRNHRRPRSHD